MYLNQKDTNKRSHQVTCIDNAMHNNRRTGRSYIKVLSDWLKSGGLFYCGSKMEFILKCFSGTIKVIRKFFLKVFL